MYVLTLQCKYNNCYNHTYILFICLNVCYSVSICVMKCILKYAIIMCTVCGIGYKALKTVASMESVAGGNTETKVRVHDHCKNVKVISTLPQFAQLHLFRGICISPHNTVLADP